MFLTLSLRCSYLLLLYFLSCSYFTFLACSYFTFLAYSYFTFLTYPYFTFLTYSYFTFLPYCYFTVLSSLLNCSHPLLLNCSPFLTQLFSLPYSTVRTLSYSTVLLSLLNCSLPLLLNYYHPLLPHSVKTQKNPSNSTPPAPFRGREKSPSQKRGKGWEEGLFSGVALRVFVSLCLIVLSFFIVDFVELKLPPAPET